MIVTRTLQRVQSRLVDKFFFCRGIRGALKKSSADSLSSNIRSDSLYCIQTVPTFLGSPFISCCSAMLGGLVFHTSCCLLTLSFCSCCSFAWTSLPTTLHSLPLGLVVTDLIHFIFSRNLFLIVLSLVPFVLPKAKEYLYPIGLTYYISSIMCGMSST